MGGNSTLFLLVELVMKLLSRIVVEMLLMTETSASEERESERETSWMPIKDSLLLQHS